MSRWKTEYLSKIKGIRSIRSREKLLYRSEESIFSKSSLFLLEERFAGIIVDMHVPSYHDCILF